MLWSMIANILASVMAALTQIKVKAFVAMITRALDLLVAFVAKEVGALGLFLVPGQLKFDVTKCLEDVRHFWVHYVRVTRVAPHLNLC